MLIIDAHCDTALSVYERGSELFRNSFHLDIERLLQNGERVQFFAAFSDPVKFKNNALTRVLAIIDEVYQAQAQHKKQFAVCTNAQEVGRAIREGKVAALLSVEGGECLNGELSILRQLYRLGVRSMLLTWNYRNLLADGAEEEYGAGLTDFGRQVVTEMNRLGMIIDVSHLCEASFNDVIALTSKPVIASHSNARAICNHVRNLNDSQLKAIADNGGVIGVNFYTRFLNNTDQATLDDVVRHIEHICSITGENHIGIGADFDGIDYTPEGLEGAQCIPALFERLEQLNYSTSLLEKIAGLNFMRVIKQILNF